MMLELLAVIVPLVLIFIYLRRGSANEPPGPPGLPIVGHLLFLGQFPHKRLLQWSKKYGPVLSVQFGSYRTVVINDGKLIRKAFSSPNIAGRPFIKLFDEVSRRKGIVFADGQPARDQRQFMLKHLKDFGAHGPSMEARILAEIENLLSNIESCSGRPLKITNFFYRNVLNALLSILLSKKFEPGDPTVAEFAQLIGEASRIDGILENLGIFIPKLAEWFPGFIGHAKRVSAGLKIQNFVRTLVEEHKKTFVAGQPRDLTDAYLEISNDASSDSSFHPSADNLVENLFDTFVAGSDTTSNSLEWATYYLCRQPEILTKLQAEIDNVIGRQRSPSGSDRAAMTYVEAFIQEVLRASTVVPLGIMHRVMDEEIVAGYRVSKDTTVIGNLHAAHYDPEVWGDPENFRPERFMDSDGKLRRVEDLVAFSAGKRGCIGEPIARNELFLFITSIFQNFDVRKEGALPPPEGYGVTVQPLPFHVVFTKRDGTTK